MDIPSTFGLPKATEKEHTWGMGQYQCDTDHADAGLGPAIYMTYLLKFPNRVTLQFLGYPCPLHVNEPGQRESNRWLR